MRQAKPKHLKPSNTERVSQHRAVHQPGAAGAMPSLSRRTEEEFYVRTDYKIIYEDDWLLVIDKPSPLPVHPGGRFFTKNLVSFLREDFKYPIHIVNRLDSETSGIVLVAKSGVMAGLLGREFEFRRVEKHYAALVIGRRPERSGCVELPLGQQQEGRFRMRCHDPLGETAQTDYEVVHESEQNGEFFTLMKIYPRTGRMHQIRAHLALTGTPIAGDKIYIQPKIYECYIEAGWHEDMLAVVKARRLMLHAERLIFKHPVTDRIMNIACEMPGEFQFAGT